MIFSGSPEQNLEAKARRVRDYWFNTLPEEERDAIIKPHFDKVHTTNDSVVSIEAAYDYMNDVVSELLEKAKSTTSEYPADAAE
jgi:hypothetical protein